MSTTANKTKEKEVEITEKKITTAKPATKKESQMYIGPNIIGVVIKGTVFNEGLPDVLQEKITETPYLKRLIIPLSRLAEATNELNKEQSSLKIIYEKVNERYKGGK